MTHPYIAVDLQSLAVPVSELVPARRNARQHAERDLEVLAASLEKFGQRKPIVAKRDTREVLAGNGTLLATQQLGRTHIAVAWFDGTDAEAMAYALADNRTAELSEWNFSELAAQLAEVQAQDENLPAALGWSDEDLSPLLAALWTAPDAEPLPDAPPHNVLISCTEEQHAVIQQAIERVRQHERDADISDGRALELIAADFVAGP